MIIRDYYFRWYPLLRPGISRACCPPHYFWCVDVVFVLFLFRYRIRVLSSPFAALFLVLLYLYPPDKTNQHGAFEGHVSISPLLFYNRQFDRVRIILRVINLPPQCTRTTHLYLWFIFSVDFMCYLHSQTCTLMSVGGCYRDGVQGRNIYSHRLCTSSIWLFSCVFESLTYRPTTNFFSFVSLYLYLTLFNCCDDVETELLTMALMGDWSCRYAHGPCIVSRFRCWFLCDTIFTCVE